MYAVKDESDITNIIQSDTWMIDVLRAAEDLNLPDWWIGAGFLRNRIWDCLEGRDSQKSRDVDLVYFNASDTTDETDWNYDEYMNSKYPFAEWEIRNQARMHYKNGFEPFVSTRDGIAHWTETATAVAVRLHNEVLEYLFCYGTDDLFNLVARPTPYFEQLPMRKIYQDRMQEKNWPARWPSIQIKNI